MYWAQQNFGSKSTSDTGTFDTCAIAQPGVIASSAHTTKSNWPGKTRLLMTKSPSHSIGNRRRDVFLSPEPHP
jgi:hypothetical protein